jgi:hypothetical protein
VWAIHPRCQHLHSGKIVSTDLDSCTVKFTRIDLGPQKLPLSSVGTLLNSPHHTAQLPTIPGLRKSQEHHISLPALEVYLYMIKLKEELIGMLKNYHDLSQTKLEKNGLLTSNELQEYGWVGSLIAIVNITTKWIDYNFQTTTAAGRENNAQLILPALALSDTYSKYWSIENSICDDKGGERKSRRDSQGDENESHHMERRKKKTSLSANKKE